ncbi:MAG: hypothetical protein IK133_09920 [Clostridia bacterium]|nr:hypothetical protein [Clostridia bacterium]MBR5384129.1 hypothetical protein [Clostridia bacterium]
MSNPILGAVVSLRRNFADLPFDTANNEEAVRHISERSMAALERYGEIFDYRIGSSLTVQEREWMKQCSLLPDTTDEYPQCAHYLRRDGRLCLTIAGEDQMTLTAYSEEGDAGLCLRQCRALAELLADTAPVAKDAQYGYLTAKPCDAGTGMRASLQLHLPLTQMLRRIPQAVKYSAEQGMTLRSLGEGIFQIENRACMGTSEENLIRVLFSTADNLIESEKQMILEIPDAAYRAAEDRGWRAYAIGRYARCITRNEIMKIWSDLQTAEILNIGLPCGSREREALFGIIRERTTAEEDTPPEVQLAARVRQILGGS